MTELGTKMSCLLLTFIPVQINDKLLRRRFLLNLVSLILSNKVLLFSVTESLLVLAPYVTVLNCAFVNFSNKTSFCFTT